MGWTKFLESLIIAFAVYIPLFLGKSRRNEESLFWASIVSTFLALMAIFVVRLENFNMSPVNFIPVLVVAAIGFVAYGLYRLNFEFTTSKISPLTWLVVIPVVDNLTFRHIGLYYTSELNLKYQLLGWHVTLNVILLALIAGVVYFLIFVRNGAIRAVVEGALAFVVGIASGYIFINYGIVTAILAQSAFEIWRIVMSMHSKPVSKMV